MAFQQQEQISQKLDTISQSFTRLTDRLQRAYTLVGDGYRIMRNLLDAVPCGILAFDTEFCLYYANQSAQNLFGDFLNDCENKNLETLEKFYSFNVPTTNNPKEYNPFTKIFARESAYFSDVLLCHGESLIPVEVWINPDVEVFNEHYIVMIVLVPQTANISDNDLKSNDIKEENGSTKESG